ncbi:MAG: sigma-70 family RNA polymerase sigma factor [Microbacterium sp.]
MRRAGFEEVFTTHYTAILRYAERRLPAYALAEELAAETFAAAWVRWQSGEGVELPWLYRVAANKVADYYRRVERQSRAEEALFRRFEELEGAKDTLDAIALRRALEELGTRDREAVLLTYWDGLSAAEVAKVLSCSIPTVWAVLSRTRKRLRTLLDADTAVPADSVRRER